MSEPDSEQYFLRVEEHFGQRRGGPLVLSPNDWSLLEGWHRQGIPLRVVLRGINQAFDRFASAGPRPDRINSLRYCEQEVLAAWEDFRAAHRRPAGDGDSAGPGLPGASTHLHAVAAACRTASTTLDGAAASCLEDAAAALEELEKEAREGTLNAREIDRRTGLLEERTRATLGALVEQTPSLDGLSLPRFSPYDA